MASTQTFVDNSSNGRSIVKSAYIEENPVDRENRYKQLFERLDVTKSNRLDANDLSQLVLERYQPLSKLDEIVQELISTIGKSDDSQIDFNTFRTYMSETEHILERAFIMLDEKDDGILDIDEIRDGFKRLNVPVDEEKLRLFFEAIDCDDDGYISFDDWRYNLIFIPYKIPGESPLQAAYIFFIEDLDLSSEGDVILSSETLNGIGYFLAGGLAGVVSRTCTAPFDRLKVYLIAQSGSNQAPMATATATATATVQGATKSAVEAASGKIMPTAVRTVAKETNILSALRYLWRQGGIKAFFVGNGLNVVKVFPESAMKFGSFEAAKRFLCKLEGVSDSSELSRAATFLAGGIGGMVAQFTSYPIDTLKFRTQCEAQYSKYTGNRLIKETAMKMWKDGGFSIFYRGLWVGVCGIFPFAALDLGTFSAMKKAYITSQAKKQNIHFADVELGNMAVLTMGALSGSVGASVVYPINLLRTRLQAQGTAAHPYRYSGFKDVFTKTVQRDGYKGLFRGLGPNLAKVAPAVSISYLVYENAKLTLRLE